MRSRLVRLAAPLVLLAACTGAPGSDSGAEPVATPMVFPPPDQVIDDSARVDSGDHGAPVVDTAPPKVEDVRFLGEADRPAEIRVVFDRPMKTDLPLPDGAWTAEPALEGTLSWADAETLAFKPAKQLPLGSHWDVTVKGLSSAAGTLQEGPRSFAVNTRRLALSWSLADNPAYAHMQNPSEGVTLAFNQSVSLESLERAVKFIGADTQADVVAGRGTPVDALVAESKEPGWDGSKVYLVRPRSGFEVGRWYRLSVSQELTGEGKIGLDKDLVGYYRGPESLKVNDITCGWNRCTTTDTWTVSFNNPVEAKGLAGCLHFEPSLGISRIDYEGYSAVVHLRDEPTVGKSYALVATPACTDTLGTHLAAKFAQTMVVQQPAAALKMPVGSGYVTPPADGEPLLLRVGAAHTGKLFVAKKRIQRADLGAFLAQNLDNWGGLSLANAPTETTEEITPMAASEHTMVDVGVHLDDALGGDKTGLVYVYVATERDGYSDQKSERKALLQITDLGISAKTGPQDVTVFVTSLTQHTPIAGAKVELMSTKGEVVWTGTTGDDGAVQGPGLVDSWEERKDDDPRVVVVSNGDDFAFLDLTDWDTKTEPYRFNLPYAWEAKKDQLVGMIFTERGVYRAGETVHVKGIVRVDRGRSLEAVANKAMSVRVINPVGDSVLAKDVDVGKFGDFDLDLPLGDDASLGTYQITAEGSGEGATGSVGAEFRVEAYRPNTFEVKVLDAKRVGDKIVARIQGRYYYGAPMGSASVAWWANRAEASFAPADFEGYSFDGRDHWDYWWEPEGASSEQVANGTAKLDDQGFADIEAPIGALDLSQGPQRLDLEAEVTDVDQQTVTGRDSVRVEAGEVYGGVKLSTTFAGTDEEVTASVVAVAAADGKAVSGVPLKVRWLQRVWSSERVEAAGGGETFSNETSEKELAVVDLVSGAGPIEAKFKAPSSGLYFAEVIASDKNGKTTKGRDSFWVWGDGASWAEDEAIVQLVAEKKAYAPGDTARVIVQSPFATSHALVTVEKAGVVWKKVMTLTGTAPIIEIPVTPDMQPNAYVSVILLGEKTIGSAKIKVPESRIGYTRFSVSTDDKKVRVAVAGDRASYLPGEKVKASVKLTDNTGAPVAGQVTFMAVDEGVLSLTGYKTPDPHGKFFAERPLAVSTNDSRKRVWAKMTPLEDGMKSDWGGDGGTGEATNYRTAFATTAAWLPHVEVGTSGTAEVEFELPDNLTTFRLMAVAATTDGRFGSGDSKIEVKKPLLVRSVLPRFISAGDAFEARATLQAVDPTMAGPVEVSLSMAGPVELDEPATKTVQLEVGKALAVTFKATAKGPGTASFGFRVRGAGQAKDADAVEVQVPVQWPAVTRHAALTGSIAKDGDKVEHPLAIPDFVRNDVGGLDVTIYSTQLAELIPSLQYLLTYPYGCVEQTTGGTLPLVALRQMMGEFALPGIPADDVLVRAQAGLDRLRSMQTWSGGISYWPGESNPHPWGSVYAGMALVQASKTKGLNVPAASLERLLGYLKDILRGQAAAGQSEWLEEMEVVKPFAAYVLALAGTPEPSYHATMYDQRLKLPDFGKVLLAMAIHEAKGDAKMVDGLLDEVSTGVRIDGDRADMKRKDDRYWYSTMDSDLRTSALLLMALIDARPASPLIPKLAKGILGARKNGEWVSTQENAFASLALAQYFTKSERASGHWNATVRIGDRVWAKAELSGADLQPTTVHLTMDEARAANGKTLTISRDGEPGPVYYTLGFAYAPKEIPKKPYRSGFTVQRSVVYASGPKAGQPVTDLAAGDVVKVTLDISSPLVRRYVAVDDPLPAGLEPVTLDFATTAKAYAAALGTPPEEMDAWDYTPSFNHIEQKDDRVTLFADYFDSGSHTHEYLARATTAGKFLAPATRVHEMYHPDVSGQGAAYELTVH
ncbi:MAG: MG2 domain-containing protein [Myxococcota bacterium]